MAMEVENHVIDLLPDYVLDILAETELSQVAEHLADCPTCQAEFQHLLLVADELPLALVLSSPPPRVKDNLMGAIHALNTKTTASSQPTLLEKLTRVFRMRLPALGLALILVLALGNILLWRQLSSSSLQANTPMRVVALVSTKDSPQAIGTMIMDPDGHYGTLVVDHLAELDFEHQYQVWLNRDGERISAGLFSVNYAGYASLELLAPLPLIQYETIGITIEPMGGSPGPTGAKVLGSEIPH